MIKKILIPLDGSANGTVALEYAIYFAGKSNASLSGIHIIDLSLIQVPLITDISCSVGITPCDGITETLEESLQEKAAFIADTFNEKCGKAGIKSDFKKVVGIVHDAVMEQAANADLIIMAKRGEHFHLAEGGFMDSVAEAVIRKAGKPVMVTPEKFTEIESMGLAYDGSLPAQKALQLCLQIAVPTAWPVTAVIVNSEAAKAVDLTRQIEEAAERHKTDLDFIILQGREEERILEFINEGAVELMFMGAYGHNRLRELLLGSTTSYIIKKSGIPVLLTH